MSGKTFSDEQLTAYLDGELPEAERLELEKSLAHDSALKLRLEHLNLPIDDIRHAADQMLAKAPDLPQQPVLQQSNSVAPFRIAASLAVGMAIGALGWSFLAQEPNDWMQAVADYQVLYVPQTIATSEQSPDVSASVLSDFGGEHALALEAMTGLTSASFKRAQILGFEGRPLLQIAYALEDGTPIALCITRVDEADRQVDIDGHSGLLGASWVANGNGFLLIGDVDQARLEAVLGDVTRNL